TSPGSCFLESAKRIASSFNRYSLGSRASSKEEREYGSETVCKLCSFDSRQLAHQPGPGARPPPDMANQETLQFVSLCTIDFTLSNHRATQTMRRISFDL